MNHSARFKIHCLLAAIFASFLLPAVLDAAPPPISEISDEPVIYTGSETADPQYYHGGFAHAVGVHKIQAFRANRNAGTGRGLGRLDLQPRAHAGLVAGTVLDELCHQPGGGARETRTNGFSVFS